MPGDRLPDTGPHDELLARADRLVSAATPGPWGWRGHDDGQVELRTLHSGGLRVVTTIRAEPCIVTLDDNSAALTIEACDDCQAKWAEVGRTGNGDLWEGYRCPKPENLGTLWLWDERGFCRPANQWAIREVTYRSDVARVEHPDAELIAAAPELITGLAAALRAQTAETSHWFERHEQLVRYALGPDGRHGVVPAGRPDLPTPNPIADAQPLAEARAERDELHTIDERDHAQEMADKPAAALAPANDPWQNWVDKAAHLRPHVEALAATRRSRRVNEALNTLAEARAAAPQPLWVGETSELTTRSKTASLAVYPPRLEVPPRTKIALYRADQTPGVTREQVLKAVGAGFTTALGPDQLTSASTVHAIADEIMTLITGEGSDVD